MEFSMKEYIYEGRPFLVEDAGACEIKVSDKTNAVSITLNASGPSVYRVSTVKGGWWWYTSTVQESVERACRELIDHQAAIPAEAACEDMHKFVAALSPNPAQRSR